jgi:primosomal replication protein N
MSFNKIIVVGNLGRDPELRYTPQGTAVCSFTIATNERKRDKSGEKVDVTTWFRVTLWGNSAETASRHLTKGSPIYIDRPPACRGVAGSRSQQSLHSRDKRHRHAVLAEVLQR